MLRPTPTAYACLLLIVCAAYVAANAVTPVSAAAQYADINPSSKTMALSTRTTSIPDPTSSVSVTYSGDKVLEDARGGHGGHGGKGGKGGKSNGGGGSGDGDAGDQESASDVGPKTQLAAVCSWLVLAVMLPFLL
ncbi:hypothetical protein FQN50_003834 [Emmonsiellopsis sp. PD_5]|nr:hypothetical protein FQN50_003834 [Emmonsiellopsis sp. PD_5]